MNFRRIDPPAGLKNVIECYWTAEGDETRPVKQKIIPDGFPELIFHFADPYRIMLKDRWEVQSKNLLAGQITGHFFLENTGTSSILGLKFRPAALTSLFNIDMQFLTDAVIDPGTFTDRLDDIEKGVRRAGSFEQRIEFVNDYFREFTPTPVSSVGQAIEIIFKKKGSVSVSELCESTQTTERQLERAFKKCVGLSPKFYARIIRFNRIFQMAGAEKLTWAQLGLETGFYDQSHFIRDFKEFTGEEPSKYFFAEANLANFFLKK
jgi:AraC-like DNA-binding protein